MKYFIPILLTAVLFFSCVSFPGPEEESDSLIIGSIIFDFPDGFFSGPPRTLTSSFAVTFLNATTSKELKVKTVNGFFYFTCKRNDKFTLKTIQYEDPAPGPGSSVGMNFDLPIKGRMHSILYLGEMKVTFLHPEYVETSYGTNSIGTFWTFRKHEFDNKNKKEELKKFLSEHDRENRWQNHDIHYYFEK